MLGMIACNALASTATAKPTAAYTIMEVAVEILAGSPFEVR
jgi:hypothetical protein